MSERPQILFASDRPDRRWVGGKTAALAALGEEGWSVPPWFAVTVAAFEQAFDPEDLEALRNCQDPDRIEELFQKIRPHPDLPSQIQNALGAISPGGEPVAVRSSAVEEDGTGHSFAGQLESFLFVGHEQVLEKIKAVWRSAFSPRVIAYRAERGLSGGPSVPAVLVLA
ncbi:MAG: PEP/pyruvate-binding domain-containing protein, partial [Phycisphaeraceae bacterium]|nr:PEP/pyruvate-binding domain-containing protein [Phycisphaeraceae bacterium]